jgi:DNA-binding FadR family transcriptional regulator
MDRFDLNLQRDQLSSQVADQLQELIVARSLASGEKLPAERELAETLGVSRSVVREALRTLAARGLVKVKPGCGAYICRPSAEHIAAPFELLLKLQQDPDLVTHLFEVRRTIELDVAAKAALRAQPDEIVALRALWQELRDTADLSRYAELDVAFHLALARAAHNDLYGVLLASVTHLLAGTIQVALHSGRAFEQGVARHEQILQAIEAHDPALARAAMLAHVDEAQRNYTLASASTGWLSSPHD